MRLRFVARACAPLWLGCAIAVGSCGGDDGGDPFGASTTGEMDSTGPAPSVCEVDGSQNGEETDVDCGGGVCPACANGSDCLLNADCESGSCQGDTCSAPDCSDGAQNQGETGIDCGGSCSPCGTGEGCSVDGDCDSGVCDEGTCAAPGCADGLLNGEETDLDCGGPTCDPCAIDLDCAQNADCASGYCMRGTCTAKSCRSDDECTELDGPCADGVCDTRTFVCGAAAINETRVCDDGDPCTLDTTCGSARCGGGTPPDCTRFDDVCTVGVCNRADGSCEPGPANEGGACDDLDPCTAGDACTRGVCLDPDGADVHLDEDFSDDMGGWSLGNDWEIGPATASAVGDVAGSDPDTDNTATADNGVAGVLIGGLVAGSGPATYLESPVLDLQTAPGDLQLRLFRWLNADVASSTEETIEIWDGASWVSLYVNPEDVTADVAWTEMTFDITQYKNDALQIRIGHDGAGGAPAIGSWSLDDIRIAPPTCP